MLIDILYRSSSTGPRETFGRTIQCRTGHAYTGEFRRRFFPEKDKACPCGLEFQTRAREHILIDCTLYDKHRIHLQKISRDVFLPTILGTEEGIKALTIYLQQSGAFTMLSRPAPEYKIPTSDDEPDAPRVRRGGQPLKLFRFF